MASENVPTLELTKLEKKLKEEHSQIQTSALPRSAAKKTLHFNFEQLDKEKEFRFQSHPLSNVALNQDPPLLCSKYSTIQNLANYSSQHVPIRRLTDVPSLPEMANYTPFTRNNLMVPEERERPNLPYLGDDAHEQIAELVKSYDELREVDSEKDVLDDRVFLKLVRAAWTEADAQAVAAGRVAHGHSPPTIVFTALKKAFPSEESEEALRKRYDDLLAIAAQCNPDIDSENALATTRVKTLHSFNELFCGRCFRFDCFIHCRVKQERVKMRKPRLTIDDVLAKMKTPCSSNCYLHTKGIKSLSPEKKRLRASATTSPEKTRDEWTGAESSMFAVFFPIHNDDFCAIAKFVMTKNCAQVFSYWQSGRWKDDIAITNEPDIPDEVAPEKPLPDAKHYRRWAALWNKAREHRLKAGSNSEVKGKKNNKAVAAGGIVDQMEPEYIPCDHPGKCTEKTCTCIQRGSSCEKFCQCPLSCANNFPGCRCEGVCDKKSCVCYFALRECDPDKCKNCGAGEFGKFKEPTCKNCRLQRGIGKHILLGISEVAGWGVFAKEHIEKGELVSEYCGEAITHEQADLRGKLYDYRKCSFLFNLNQQYAVDATRKGNKIRFANHSSKNANCQASIKLVNGDHRIGIFAKRDIEPGEELFFDYLYNQKDRCEFVSIERP